MKIKSSYIYVIIVLSVIIGLSFSSCKDFGVPDYKLTINLADGVQGTPEAGEYTHKELTTVDYQYSPSDSDLTVEVLVNGGRWAPEDTVTMFTNITLDVSIFEIRGTWDFSFSQPTDSSEENFNYKVTFTGDSPLSGTFVDVREDGQQYTGLWTITSSVLVMTYSDWENYVFSGVVPVMVGDWTGLNTTGKWSATK